ncbi:hypothetical protein ANCDUO_01415 [Ancylostoma duodenale]|uniref:Ig-like domain-containing protein n=1 Tax=Ancylostoma duodenale TaxID=51022 RepID=A0A0C2HF89_9BILA|nr:hypothetical protein ANCDUO_01415 [Ancylostoma duodenale]
MECLLEADPPPTIAWQHSGNVITPSARVVQMLTPQGGILYKANLVIKFQIFRFPSLPALCSQCLVARTYVMCKLMFLKLRMLSSGNVMYYISCLVIIEIISSLLKVKEKPLKF